MIDELRSDGLRKNYVMEVKCLICKKVHKGNKKQSWEKFEEHIKTLGWKWLNNINRKSGGRYALIKNHRGYYCPDCQKAAIKTYNHEEIKITGLNIKSSNKNLFFEYYDSDWHDKLDDLLKDYFAVTVQIFKGSRINYGLEYKG